METEKYDTTIFNLFILLDNYLYKDENNVKNRT